MLPYPSVTACFRYIHLLKLFKNRRFGTEDAEEEAIHKALSDIRISDIFDGTTDSLDTLTYCQYKLPGAYGMEKSYERECNQIFNVTKFFTLEYICYRIDFVALASGLSFFRQANTPAYPGVLYEIVFNRTFNSYQTIKILTHEPQIFPYRSMAVAPTYERPVTDQLVRRYTLTYFNLIQLRLPPPYRSMCRDYSLAGVRASGQFSRVDCREQCIKNQTVQKYRKIPFTAIESNGSSDLKHLSYNDVADSSRNNNSRNPIVSDLGDFEEKCGKMICPQIDCQESMTFNRIIQENNQQLTVKVCVPSEPSVTVRQAPLILMPEYLTYIMSIVGTWLGFSVIDVHLAFGTLGRLASSFFRRVKKGNNHGAKTGASSSSPSFTLNDEATNRNTGGKSTSVRQRRQAVSVFERIPQRQVDHKRELRQLLSRLEVAEENALKSRLQYFSLFKDHPPVL